MKKLLLALTAVAAMASCEKETMRTLKGVDNCKCGLVTNVEFIQDIDWVNDVAVEYYQYTVVNNCTNNESIVTTQYNDPLEEEAVYKVGDTYCD